MTARRTKVTIVAGFLGAGKTSVLRHLIRSAAAEKTAVLVNEIGALGIDGDLLSSADAQLDVEELVGGCICCTAMIVFKHKLVQMLRRRPERLFIEPTGLAAVGTLVDVFSEPGIAPAVELDPTLVVVDPRHWAQDHIRTHELYREQCARADVMLVTHSDCCDAELLERFRDSHAEIPLITANHGVLDGDWSNLAKREPKAEPEPLGLSGTSVAGFHSETFTWSADQRIELSHLSDVLAGLPHPDTVLRIKGMIHSPSGCHEVQWTNSALCEGPSATAEASRLVMIAQEGEASRNWWQSVVPLLEKLAQSSA